LLESRILLSAPAADTWIAGNGSWDVGSNWSLGHAPGSSDTAVINSTATISIQSGDTIQVQSLTTGSAMTLTLQNAGTFQAMNLNVGTGTTVDLEGGSYLGGANFNVGQGATVDLTGGQTTTYGGTLSGSGAGTVLFQNGNLAVATGGLTLNLPGGMFQWTGGIIDTALGDVTNLGTMNLAGAGEKKFYNDGTLSNYGTIIQSGSGNLGLHSDNVSPTTLNNEAGASYLIESDAGIDNPDGGQVAVYNEGTIKKTAGTGTSTLNINGVLSNSGTLSADSGTLDLEPVSFNQMALTGIGFASQVTTNVYSSFTGTSGGGAPYSGLVGTLTTGSVQFGTATGFTWHPFSQTSFGADITGSFGVTLPASYTFELYSSDGSQLYIDGKLVVDDGGVHAQQLASGSATLSAGQHTFEIQFFNNGTGPSGVDLLLPALSNPLTLTAGTWNALDGATLQFPTGANIVTNDANISLGGSGATISGLSGLATNNGSFSVTSGANFTTIGDFTNNGSLTVGAGSTFTVKGKYTQSSTAALNVQIGGTPASGQFGQVVVQDAANLAGNFVLNLVNNYGPSSGQNYVVVTFANVSGAFANFSGLAPFFTQSLGSTTLTLTDAAVTAADLGLTSVTAPTTATTGQQITVNWQVNNSSSNAANGNWQDSVYLSTTPTITGSSVLLGSVTHTGGLAANGSYTASLTAAVPALPLGNYYVLVQADSLYQVPVSSRVNDILAASTGQLAITVPSLTLGTATQGTFTDANQDQYYQVTAPAGGALNVTLTSTASSGALAVYVSQGVLPTPYSYQAAGNLAGQPNQSLTISAATGGTYYILVHSISGAAATAAYSLTATQTNALSISGISSYPGGNAGNVTVEIDGVNFTPQTTASLSLGGTVLNATAIDFVNASQLFATFNLTGAAVGGYTLSVQQGTQSATAASKFQVVAAQPNNDKINIDFGVPQYVRTGRTGTISLTYDNTSDNDIVAPFLFISSTDPNVSFSTPDDPNNFVQQGQVLAVASSGPAGILRPGQSGQLTLTLLTTGSGGSQIPLDLGEIVPGQTIDFAALKSSVKPSTISSTAWDVIYGNLMNMLGSTTDSYDAALAEAATYLGNLGESTSQISDIGRLWSFLVAQASADFPNTTMASTTDASLPTPGSLALSISRTFQSSIAGRYSSGMFGLGWTTPWQTTLSVESSGNVTIDTSGVAMSFFPLPNKSYLDSAGVFGTLTQSGGVYTYSAPSGIQWVFLANGLLNYQQDANGNRITLGYNAQNQIVSLTYSNPSDPSEPTEQLTLTYNAQGFVSQVADGTGNTWSYSYDSSGHLLAMTAPGGLTTSYSYDTGSNPETANALLSITNPDSAQINYTYDPATGRLTGRSQNGGANPITYTYDGEAEVTTSDASGDSTTTWYNDLGKPGRMEDPLGGIATFSYDTNGNLTSATDAAGNTYQYVYDTNGNVTQTINPLGQTVQMTYGPLDELTSMTDAAGNTTQYSYNTAGNLLSIAYPDGTKQSFTYDPLGNPVQTVLQNGDPISYQYNAQGLVTQESFADGTSQTFTYDAHGNLLTANTYDAGGNLTGTTTEAYNAANQLLSITYPNGQFLKFTYNAAGQRTQSVDQSSYKINYAYDTLGRLSELTDGSGNRIVQYTYNNLGQLVKKVNGNGTYTTYTYDANGNLTQEVNYVDSSGTTVNSSFTYTYNVLNEPTSVTDSAGNVTKYGYDALGQLTQLTLPDGTSITYVYNAAGDRTEVLTNGTPTNYSSNADNEITQVGSTTYTYDPNGNLRTVTDSSGTTTYTYNDLNQLVSIANPDGSVQTFQYSPLGFMVGASTTSGGTTSQTNYLVDPTGMGKVVAAYNGSGSLIAHYNYGLGLVSQTGPSGAGYYDFDVSGNTVGITESNGAYVNQYSYLPFGETTTVSAALPNPFTFAGQLGVMQIAPNLFSMRARNYTPATGQFLSNDPLGLRGGDTDLRRYVNNSPVVNTDPTGQQGPRGGGFRGGMPRPPLGGGGFGRPGGRRPIVVPEFGGGIPFGSSGGFPFATGGPGAGFGGIEGTLVAYSGGNVLFSGGGALFGGGVVGTSGGLPFLSVGGLGGVAIGPLGFNPLSIVVTLYTGFAALCFANGFFPPNVVPMTDPSTSFGVPCS
jgi:RHS repeat-associated protein